jgi:hypothetical protein
MEAPPPSKAGPCCIAVSRRLNIVERKTESGGVRMKLYLGFILALAVLSGCAQEPTPKALDYRSTKRVTITFDYPDIIENNVPEARVAVDFMNLVSMLRIYVDGNDVGGFKLNDPNMIDVPGNAAELQIRSAGQGMLLNETRAFIDPVDISRFPPNSTISIICNTNLLSSEMGRCTAS